MTLIGVVVVIGMIEWIAVHVIVLTILERRDAPSLDRHYGYSRERALKASPPRPLRCWRCEMAWRRGQWTKHRLWHARHNNACKVCTANWRRGYTPPHRPWHDVRW